MPADISKLEQDEEAELLAELERIRKERAEEAAKKQLEEAALKEKEVRDELLRGNPLVNSAQAPAFQVTPLATAAAAAASGKRPGYHLLSEHAWLVVQM